MSGRIVQGYYRYGPPKRSKKYMTRLELELKEYKKTGNLEYLRNIANYCFLESLCPENPKFHDDNNIASVTRGRV